VKSVAVVIGVNSCSFVAKNRGSFPIGPSAPVGTTTRIEDFFVAFVIDYFLMTIDYFFFVVLGVLRGEYGNCSCRLRVWCV
jgi:hypothetical protein